MGESFHDLAVWQRAMELTVELYKLTATFPETERYGLVNQLRRASVSIPSNIAEGYGRATTGEYLQFLGHARGSACEVETQLLIAKTLGFSRPESLVKAEELSSEVGRMLRVMMQTLKARQSARPPSP